MGQLHTFPVLQRRERTDVPAQSRIRIQCSECGGRGEVLAHRRGYGEFDAPCPNRYCDNGIVMVLASELGEYDVLVDAEGYAIGELQ